MAQRVHRDVRPRMQLVSIQVASPRLIARGDGTISTGIFKEPVPSAELTGDGVVGDAVVNTEHHGGPDQAVYVYSSADYQWWEAELGRHLAPGIFGENLTLTDFGDREVMIGDRWQIGEVLLETTAPRIPCATFASKMGEADWIKRFRAARRPGFYARVLHGGTLRPGDPVFHRRSIHDFGLLEMFELVYETEAEVAVLQRALAAPIAARARTEISRRLDRIAGGS